MKELNFNDLQTVPIKITPIVDKPNYRGLTNHLYLVCGRITNDERFQYFKSTCIANDILNIVYFYREKLLLNPYFIKRKEQCPANSQEEIVHIEFSNQPFEEMV